MKVYLDNCCFNRPFDDQSQIRVRLESEAKMAIQTQILEGNLKLIWSYMMDFENNANPFQERKIRINEWRFLAVSIVDATEDLISDATSFMNLGLKNKDSLHLACAKLGNADIFFTTDDQVLNRRREIHDFQLLNPVEFFTETQHHD